MAEVYKKFAGVPNSGKHGAYEDPLNYVFSHAAPVEAFLRSEAIPRAMAAGRQLASHRATGAASIEVDEGSVDWTIWLTDRSAEPAALAIEYGAAENRGGVHALAEGFPEVFR